MKKLLITLKSALAISLFAFIFASCSKDEANKDLLGTWIFREANMILYFDGETFNMKEEGWDLSEFNDMFRGFSLNFSKEHVVMRIMMGESPPTPYSVSGDMLTIRDNYVTIIWRYKVVGNTLELIWTRDMMEVMMGRLPDEYYEFDDVELILSLNKVM